MIDFNTEPYFNDFSEDNKFYSILFRPSVAVQARELNQFQTILQNQIAQQGSHIFKNGSVVIPGEFSINTVTNYVKLSSIGGMVDITTLIGTYIKHTTNGLQALVVHAEPATATDPDTLYVSYTTGADDNTTIVFPDASTISTVDGLYTGIVAAITGATGKGSISTIQRGIYYINGHFVLCESQTIALDKYSNTPTYRIGFKSIESIVTADDAGYDSLLDNAQGSYNFAAPGAHRHFIDLVLTALTLDEPDETFVELGRVVDGIILSTEVQAKYAILEKTFARRTYEESGDYTIKPFQVDVREHRNNDRGSWNALKSYKARDVVLNSSIYYMAIYDMVAGLAAPTHTSGIVNLWEQTSNPYYNRGIYSPDATTGIVGDITKLAVGIEPGKAYVQGYEIEKIATSYVEIDKPRDILLDTALDNNCSVPTSVGSYIRVASVHKLPPMTSGALVSIYDAMVTTPGTSNGNVIGTCRVRSIQTDTLQTGGGTGLNTYCRLFLDDIKLNTGKDFVRDVKSFYYASSTFTANVTSDSYSTYLGTITTSSTSITVTGSGTQFVNGSLSQRLKVGDWIYYGTPTTPTYIGQVDTVASDTSITLTANAVATVTNTASFRVQTYLNEPIETALVFPMPHYAAHLVADHSYYITQTLSSDSVATNTLNVSVPVGTLIPDAANYYVQDASGNSIGAANFTVSTSGSTAALTFGSPPTTSYVVYATVYKTGVASRKTKTLTSASVTFTTAQTNKSVLTLSNTDCYKIVNVFQGTTDISDWYKFGDGQTNSYYNFGTLTLKPSYPTPTTAITVNYQYFVHSAGDFCDKDSYINVDYSLIPSYSRINLRDALDFRPVLTAGNTYSLTMPKRGYNATVDLTYYLPRLDKIAIDSSGKIFSITGSSSLNPNSPADSVTGMTICSLLLNPYTFTSGDVNVTRIDNKRYTMRDIGTLEKRIGNLEYYTALSLLEQETASLSITDSSGFDRFKNGFIVNNFSGHALGDTSSLDYMCSIDMGKGELRPFIAMDNVNLLLDNINSTHVGVYGDVIMLPLNPTTPHVELAKNKYASRTENVNPFAVFTFLGTVKINPSSDDWIETQRAPDVVVNVDNYTPFANLAEEAGVLGTVYNAWETNWTGETVVTSVTSTLPTGAWADGPQAGRGNLTFEFDITTTFATEFTESRTGITTSLTESSSSYVSGERMISTAVIPYMRSRNVLVQIKGMLPNTQFHMFFDNTSVDQYCTPATILYYTPLSGKFDSSTNVGIDAAINPTRKVNGNSQVCLNIGDVITGSSSGAAAVVVGVEKAIDDLDVATYKLYVMNCGTFTTNETFTGSVSGATGKFLSKTVPTTFISGVGGDINLLFNIPNTDSTRFRTGTREFKVMDAVTFDGSYSSRGLGSYQASGTIQTWQSTVVSTRSADLVTVNAPTEISAVQTATTSRTLHAQGWYDPLAQTFLVESKGGAFLSKVDLFFAAKDKNKPVSIEIREVVNGFPGATVLPFSRVSVPASEVNLSSTIVRTYDDTPYPKYDTPTTIYFPSPVYVQDNTEYALVILSDSNNYRVWISQMGDIIPDSSNAISKQPYNGVFFKSQNASTWTANQEQDLKFTLWRANFDISVPGNVILTNDTIPTVRLAMAPFQLLTGSSTVRVWHRNHGFSAGDSVTISGATSVDTNITAAKLNSTFVISNPTLDSYTIVIVGSGSNNSTNTGYVGGANVIASRNIKYETIYPSIRSLGFSDTNADYSIITTEASTRLLNNEESCIANGNNDFYTSKIVPSGSTGKLNIKVAMRSTNAALSPLIDTHGASAIVVSNKVDSPSESTTNVAAIDRVSLWSASASSFAFSGSTITSAVSGNQDIMKRIIPGTYIEIANATTAGNNGKVLVTAVDTAVGTLTITGKTFTTENAGATTILYYYNSFFDEITPIESSSYSKYVSKVISLSNQSSLLRIKYAVSAPTASDVLVYYKIGTNGTQYNTLKWTLANPDKPMIKTAIGSNKFYDVDYTIDNLPLFDSLKVKLVMKSTNTAAVPRIKDLRIIACASTK